MMTASADLLRKINLVEVCIVSYEGLELYNRILSMVPPRSSSIHSLPCTAVALQVLREAAECDGLEVADPTDDQIAAWWVLLAASSGGAGTATSPASPVHIGAPGLT
jgi:hypothetical protein